MAKTRKQKNKDEELEQSNFQGAFLNFNNKKSLNKR